MFTLWDDMLYVNGFYTVDVKNNSVNKHISDGNNIIATKVNNTSDGVMYYHSNHIGSTALLTDKNSDKHASYLYLPYGEMWVTDSNPNSAITRLFTGHEYDSETGLYYANARYYDPELAVFTTSDPAMSGMNHYGYCGGNPVMYSDPSGLQHTPTAEQKARMTQTKPRGPTGKYRVTPSASSEWGSLLEELEKAFGPEWKRCTPWGTLYGMSSSQRESYIGGLAAGINARANAIASAFCITNGLYTAEESGFLGGISLLNGIGYGAYENSGGPSEGGSYSGGGYSPAFGGGALTMTLTYSGGTAISILAAPEIAIAMAIVGISALITGYMIASMWRFSLEGYQDVTYSSDGDVDSDTIYDYTNFLGYRGPDETWRGRHNGKIKAEFYKSLPQYGGTFQPPGPPKDKGPLWKRILLKAAELIGKLNGGFDEFHPFDM